MANKIIVLGFNHLYGAESMLEHIENFEKQGLIALEDAVIASRDVGTGVEIMQARPKVGKASLKGSGVGLLAGLLLGGPLLGVAAGAGIGSIAGSIKDYGLDDHFVEEITESLKPGSSALFLLVKEAQTEEFQDKLAQYEARVLTTNLPPEGEKALRAMLGEQ
jgi:uncharacterized membrane protein